MQLSRKRKDTERLAVKKRAGMTAGNAAKQKVAAEQKNAARGRVVVLPMTADCQKRLAGQEQQKRQMTADCQKTLQTKKQEKQKRRTKK
jgi:hypothetical protein